MTRMTWMRLIFITDLMITSQFHSYLCQFDNKYKQCLDGTIYLFLFETFCLGTSGYHNYFIRLLSFKDPALYYYSGIQNRHTGPNNCADNRQKQFL